MALNCAFDANTLPSLRQAVLAEAAAAGMPGDQAADVMLAVHELAANVVRHGAGAGQLEMRVRDGRLHCLVSDVPSNGNGGPVTRQAEARPWPVQHGHGLWLVQVTADQVNVAWGSA